MVLAQAEADSTRGDRISHTLVQSVLCFGQVLQVAGSGNTFADFVPGFCGT